MALERNISNFITKFRTSLKVISSYLCPKFEQVQLKLFIIIIIIFKMPKYILHAINL